jgi:3-oxoacyl-[acyl-carrier-protein] synthase II
VLKRRAVITGIGLITPLGNTREANWQAILAGRSGIGPIHAFDASRLPCRIGGEVKDFDPALVLDPKEVRRYDRFVHLAVHATAEAIADAGLVISEALAPRVGVIYGSGMGGLTTILENYTVLRTRGPSRVSPFLSPGSAINMAAGIISIRWGLKGPNYATASACSTSGHALADALHAIQRGDADVVVAGGSEAVLTELTVASFASARALSTRNDHPEAASRPFDANRDGFVLSEGSSTLIVEELGHARARGARIYAELAGAGMSGDAYHVTAADPEGAGAARAMARALETAEVALPDVSYINAHGTSTEVGDASETRAIRSLFRHHADRLKVSSTKSMTGHMLGAAGAAEAAYTALALFHQVYPPTINQDKDDPACDLDYVPNVARSGAMTVALSNSFGFGGTNVALALRRYA